MKRRPSGHCRGAILPLVTLLLALIFAMVAFTVDSNLAAASKEQAQHYARIAALASIETYIGRLGAGDSHATAMAKALARAQGVSKINSMVGEKSVEPDLATSSGPGALLEPGVWTNVSARCGGSPPCFVVWHSGDAGTPNAMRITGQFFKDGIVPRLAPGIFHVSKFSANVRAVASIVPRHGIFLVDNSASMERDTHEWNKDEFAFHLADPFHAHVWNDSVVPRGSRGGGTPVDPKVHYANDYVAVQTLGDADYDSTYAAHHPSPSDGYHATRDDYLIDRFRAGPYIGPEPLTDVFHGLNAALETFTSRHVAGDKAGIIFYDQTLSWPRVLKLTADFDYLKQLTDFDVPNPASAMSQFNLIAKFGLFPSWSANTNMSLAIIEAFNQLKYERTLSTAVPSADFIVLIGDGLGNCQTCVDANGSPTSSGNCARGAGCDDSYAYYNRAASELNTLVNKTAGIRETGIPLHFIEVGPYVQPHTVDRRNTATSQCFSDAEWRLFDNNKGNYYGFVDAPNWDSSTAATKYANASAADPFLIANSNLYKVAVQTQGIWGPVRPARAKVDGVCPPIKCADPTDPDLVPGTGSGVYRRIRDPECRSLEDQISDYMREIIADNPYTIVQVE